MEHMDEKIISMLYKTEKVESEKDEKQKPQWQYDLQQAVLHLNGEQISFSRRILVDGKMEIVMPDNFTIMSEEDAKMKYPSERRPSIIYTNKETSINLTFNHTAYEIEPDEMEDFKDTMIAVIKRAQPAAKWLKDGVMEIDQKDVGYCMYMTPALDCNLFLYQLFTELEGKALLITFTCTDEEREDWEAIAHVMMESLKWKSIAEGEEQA